MADHSRRKAFRERSVKSVCPSVSPRRWDGLPFWLVPLQDARDLSPLLGQVLCWTSLLMYARGAVKCKKHPGLNRNEAHTALDMAGQRALLEDPE